ncbi:DEAD-box ATP-dependent RNA helicase 37-like [Histomonas meleagridis]|uniref:DEAD-box ATP-dependent RNA helicase 37-like n=1 Tax=Histomonas meleagridis TaxID=135588 RepID=UPI00355A768F|nr:DEAD-box ATP-dependent RNA helicase 37-like [Histomonas meleagridis]KAH0800746.1 DEAD-box ATP-dependent RNA helicase 37-like [Histomonas meleagridis]
MSSSLYVPPHLRNKQQQTQQNPNPPPNHNDSRFQNRDFGNHAMIRSVSTPTFRNVDDEEIERIFSSNQDTANMSVYEAEVRVTPESLSPITQFPRCGVRNEILFAVGKMGYKSPTAVQKFSIPYVLSGRDVLVTSQTGSGKTAAYMLPVLTQLQTTKESRDPCILVLAPTRELALQIQDETLKFSKFTNYKTVCVFGGEPIYHQLPLLRNGCDILIATPGRLIDIIESRNAISLACIKFLILDEADRMLDMGFEPQIRHIIDDFDMPTPSDRQTLLFSATFPREVQNLARQYMKNDTTRIEVGIQDAPTLIEQRFVYVDEDNKLSALLDKINEVNGQTLVFAERKVKVDSIEDYLYDEGCHVVAIHGDREMSDRRAALRGFTSGKAQIMVATDVAARGIDIPNVAHVINLDLPTDVDSYIHRIGRTGRAGKNGIATSFWNESNIPFLQALLAHFRANRHPVPEGLEGLDKDLRNQRKPDYYNRNNYNNYRSGNRRKGGFRREHSFDNVSYRR